MNLSELRKRLSPSNFIKKSTPVLLGATLLVSTSCSNVKEFASRSKASEAQPQSIADEAGVEHAYTANKKSDADFVKLLEHKMNGTSRKQPAPRETADATEPTTVQELMAAGKDPFLDSSPSLATTAHAVSATTPVENDSTPPVIISKQDAVAARKSPPVLDLTALPETEPATFMASKELEKKTKISEEQNTQPVVSDEPQQPEFGMPAEEKSLFPERQETLVDTSAPRPFVDQAEEESNVDVEIPAWAAKPEIQQVNSQNVEESKFPEFTVPVAESSSEDVAAAKPAAVAEQIVQKEAKQETISHGMEVKTDAVAPVADQIAFTQGNINVSSPEVCPPTVAECPPGGAFPAPAYCPPMAAGPQVPYSYAGSPQSTMYPAPEISGDEYIHDGGDSGTKVYYNEFSRFGLDVEDTIAEYDDDAGVAHVKASTRATIYAPKFAAVRTATLPYTDVKIVKAAGHQDQRFLAGVDTKLMIDEKTHNDEALGMRLRSRPSGIEGKAADNSIHQNLAVRKHVKLLNAYEEIRFFREGRLERVNNAIIENAIAAALDWNGDQGVNIYAHDFAGQEVQARITAQDYTRVEDRSTPGDLTIVKVVDKKIAKPGEELTFTIRFDNTGDRPLRNIRIVDNLSPRLVYIASSVDSDLNGKVDTEDNGRGSQILTFSFEDELKGHTGGWVSFKCRVR